MRQLFVVTHPEATHHVDGLVGGWHDSALTRHGHECASRIAEAVAASIPSGDSVEVFSSDLQRTRRRATG